MKTEHTPGPWEIRQGVGPFSDRENDYKPFDICTENFSELYDAGKRICTLSDGWSKEDKANARLIAAAPEMLEICKEIADDSRCDLINSERRIRLYAAIKKAEAL